MSSERTLLIQRAIVPLKWLLSEFNTRRPYIWLRRSTSRKASIMSDNYFYHHDPSLRTHLIDPVWSVRSLQLRDWIFMRARRDTIARWIDNSKTRVNLQRSIIGPKYYRLHSLLSIKMNSIADNDHKIIWDINYEDDKIRKIKSEFHMNFTKLLLILISHILISLMQNNVIQLNYLYVIYLKK